MSYGLGAQKPKFLEDAAKRLQLYNPTVNFSRSEKVKLKLDS